MIYNSPNFDVQRIRFCKCYANDKGSLYRYFGFCEIRERLVILFLKNAPNGINANIL